MGSVPTKTKARLGLKQDDTKDREGLIGYVFGSVTVFLVLHEDDIFLIRNDISALQEIKV